MWIKDIRDYILYEDKDILVCHKPAGLAVQNARVGNMDMESLLKNYIAQKVPGKMPYLGIIHRQDQGGNQASQGLEDWHHGLHREWSRRNGGCRLRLRRRRS